jgi:photosystem II stability/assembly factor-like uncharacterized protein
MLLVLIIGATGLFASGENFQGMIKRQFTQELKKDVSIEEPILQKGINSENLISIENQNIDKIVDADYKYVDFMTSWAPKEIREKNEKKLVKLYPFLQVDDSIVDEIIRNKLEFVKPLFAKWQHIGLQGAGVITSVDYSKQNHDKLLLGTEASGLYLTSDFGNQWTKLVNFPFYHINRVGVDPLNDSHFLVLANGIYLYESTNNGNSWSLINTFDEYEHYQSNLIWNENSILINVNEEAIISNDNGQTWNGHELPSLPSGLYRYVRINPSGTGLTMGYELFDMILYTTQDFGVTWNPILNQDDVNGLISAYDITDDGQTIMVAVYNHNTERITIWRSDDGGINWQTNELPDNLYLAQDLIIDKDNHDHVALFLYMPGFFESFDGGQSFTSMENLVNTYDSILLSDVYANEYLMTIPLDLRFSHMKAINKPLDNKTLYLLPTDQGLFVYDNLTHEMKNIAKDLYLGDTGMVGVTSCPRIYAGLWHLGHFFIDENGTINARRTSEKYGAGTIEGSGCDSPVLYENSYYPDGLHEDYLQKGLWLWNTISFRLQPGDTYTYHDGWWYGYGGPLAGGSSVLARIDIDNEIYEEISFSIPATYFRIRGFYIEENTGGANYWVLIQDSNSPSDDLKLWKSTDLVNWTMFADLTSLTDPIYTEFYEDYWESGSMLMTNYDNIFMHIEGSQIILGGNGLFVSNDSGQTWNEFFPFAKTSNIIEDESGRLFVGLSPHLIATKYLLGEDVTGLWYSYGDGNSWQLLEPDVSKSWITGLAYESVSRKLYASTKGETLLEFDFDKYFPPVELEKIEPPYIEDLEEKIGIPRIQ